MKKQRYFTQIYMDTKKRLKTLEKMLNFTIKYFQLK